ncbi:MAG: hypothetical protein AVDCRST_MAG49-1457 [uncultured Thermomicrobiales bacterium]|uniref:Metallo-beta-lactamase domain-containing protein n=1 Tax=uncultured Thermomicrobiales bacterium TaxID=1645740 RepID=A0A6J4UDF6_9BACT|nr:MAG: hypothetical protein AVDCRST_MAG49-1457 [uncultured Thermomicrobiales bacterium]
MPIAVQSFGSGSSGNALLVESSETLILIDCGLAPRSLAAALAASGRSLGDLDAVLLTHEHVDHMRALSGLARAGVTVVCTAGTARSAAVASERWEEIRPATELRLGDLAIEALPVSHDAAEPCGFTLSADGVRVTVATDLGRADAALHGVVAVSDLVVLEANHDEEMLRRGPYPARTKRRVLSDLGHLSNDASGALLAASFVGTRRLPTVWLAHLSQTNNRPELARQAVARALAARDQVAPILPLPRREVGPVWRSNGQPVTPIQLAMGL